jgi:hypothetical protein
MLAANSADRQALPCKHVEVVCDVSDLRRQRGLTDAALASHPRAAAADMKHVV